jgi:glutathione peroxidase
MLLVVALAVFTLSACASTDAPGGYPLHYVVKGIDGNDVDLSAYAGNVLLIVNVASKCGLTPQYEDLEALYQKYKDEGLRILAFPANNFLSQEPGTNEEIKSFCSTKYNVTFDLFAKVSVKGDDIAPLYEELTSKEKNGRFGGSIKWNFSKFLIARDGQVVDRFAPQTSPSDEEVVAAIERELAKEPPAKSGGTEAE